MDENSASSERAIRGACSDIAVLLVEDEPAFRAGLGGMLREDGHDVLEYAEPGHLPPLATLGHVSVVLCDFDMPGQNGVVLADRLHAAHPTVPITLVTANRSAWFDHEMRARPFLSTLEKPVSYDDVHALIHRLAT